MAEYTQQAMSLNRFSTHFICNKIVTVMQ